MSYLFCKLWKCVLIRKIQPIFLSNIFKCCLRSVHMFVKSFFNMLSYASIYDFTSFSKNLEKNTKKSRKHMSKKKFRKKFWFFRLVQFFGDSPFLKIDNSFRKSLSGPRRAFLMPKIARLEYFAYRTSFLLFSVGCTVLEIWFFGEKKIFGKKLCFCSFFGCMTF